MMTSETFSLPALVSSLILRPSSPAQPSCGFAFPLNPTILCVINGYNEFVFRDVKTQPHPHTTSAHLENAVIALQYAAEKRWNKKET